MANERQGIEKLYKRAIAVGKRKGLQDEEAEDFASWLAIKWLEGKYQHSTLDQSLIDYRRGEHGDSRSDSGRLRQSATRRGISLTPDETDERGQAALRLAERAIADGTGEPEEQRAFDFDPADYLSGRYRWAYELVMQDELTMKQAAAIMGVSESRVSQVLSVANSHVKRITLLGEAREAVRRRDLELLIDWISL